MIAILAIPAASPELWPLYAWMRKVDHIC